MPTLRLSDTQKPGVSQVKRYILMLLRSGEVDQASLIAKLSQNPLFKSTVVTDAISELMAEGKVERV